MRVRSVKSVKYYVVPRHRKVVCTTQRAASASMVESLAPMNNINIQILPVRVEGFKKKEDWPVLLWIRNPFDRIACAYDVFGAQFASVDAYIENIIKNQNPHWSPMTTLHRFRGEFLPTHVYPFEHLAETWAEELPSFPLQHIGAKPDRRSWEYLREEISGENCEAIENHWSEDFALHRWALESGVHEVAA